MKRKWIFAAIGAALFSAAAWAQMGPGMGGFGGGMMGGYGGFAGHGPGMMGDYGGYGPGMAGGYGPEDRNGPDGAATPRDPDSRGNDGLDLTDQQREKLRALDADARRRMEAVLTPEQRDRLHEQQRGW